MVPIFSWLFLRGKCAYCSKKISAHYLLLEITTGLTFLVTFLEFNFLQAIPSIIDSSILLYTVDWYILQQFLFYIIEFSLLIGIFFYDLIYRIIPDTFSLSAIAIGIAGGLIFGDPTWLNMLLGGALGFLFFFLQYIVSQGRWIGGGDLRMGALMGVLLGWEKTLLALAVAYILGTIISIYLLIHKKAKGKTQIPLGPFLVIGLIGTLFYGDIIMNFYLNILIP